MKISLFGKSLFEIKKSTGEYLYNNGADRLKKSEHLIDFYKDIGSSMVGDSNSTPDSWNFIQVANTTGDTAQASGGIIAVPNKKKENKVEEKKEMEFSPKEIHKMKCLHDEHFVLKTDSAYVDEQIEMFKDKLGMIRTAEYDMNRGTIEIASILGRMQNRKKYPEHKEFYEEFPYTTTARIADLVKKYSYLQLGQVEQFLADMPKEASDVMKAYTKETKDLCDKKPIFYIIANKKDFQKSEKRRDPILLAQSPFGHVWQILGAWDEEMILVDEL